MDNPLQRQAPHDARILVHEFARDLAYGVVEEYWKANFSVYISQGSQEIWQVYSPQSDKKYVTDNYFNKLIEDKWKNTPPSIYLLYVQRYLYKFGQYETLTDKAFTLLDKPHSPISIFISYSRRHSSALALLIEARLKIVGIPNPFVDKNLLAGDEWHGRLEKIISECNYFVILIGEQYDEGGNRIKTLDSEMVKQEIEWAEKYNKTIISIWHNCRIPRDVASSLTRFNAIQVEGESAEAYENAVNKLLNTMQYATY
jgi:hypothetical protein